MPARNLATIALIVASLTGGMPAGASGRDGIVQGTVTTGPTCPGPARLDRPDCRPRPKQTTVKVFVSHGGDRPIATVTTDRNGRFRLTLAPGSYRLVASSPGGVSIGKPRDVTVTAGSTTSISLFVDTGMR